LVTITVTKGARTKGQRTQCGGVDDIGGAEPP
jgi:hypothetical protein